MFVAFGRIHFARTFLKLWRADGMLVCGVYTPLFRVLPLYISDNENHMELVENRFSLLRSCGQQDSSR
jgi:hypothetical protein